ncbi:MAG: phosphomannomutase/phosphoglucomutase [Pseudomonadales bacterium]|nr:phosphomannomutase/phosphoglucomutase [Pseudomonadales bacterium]
MKYRSLAAFRLGDIRGLYPREIDERFARDFAGAFIDEFAITGTVAVGRDMRESSPGLQRALMDGLTEFGVDVADIGLCPTELGYFASTFPGFAAAIVVTASHNPARYNGLKCVLAGGEAVTFESGLSGVMRRMQSRRRVGPSRVGAIVHEDLRAEYLDWMVSHFDAESLQGAPVALNGLNGTASTLASELVERFNLPVKWFRKDPGPIPEEGADPANPRLANEMKSYMAGQGFALGVAWDGDCDRCVFFDGDGNIVPAYYIVGLLAATFLASHPGRAIVYDTKLCWNTLDIIAEFGGQAVPSETGHAFMKRKMRESDAIYGGELSSHHFFGDFFHCDSGMFAWLKILETVNHAGETIAELVEKRRRLFTTTPEINLRLGDTDRAFNEILNQYRTVAESIEHFDGLSFTMPGDWRFSLRRSKTEPLVRVNFESRGNGDVLLEQGPGVIEALAPFSSEDIDIPSLLYIQ